MARSRPLICVCVSALMLLTACGGSSGSGDKNPTGPGGDGSTGNATAINSQARCEALASGGADNQSDASSEDGPPFGPINYLKSAEASDGPASGQGIGQLTVNWAFTTGDGHLEQFTVTSNNSAMAAGATDWQGNGSGLAQAWVIIEVADGEVDYEFAGSLQATGDYSRAEVSIERQLQGGGWEYPKVFEAEDNDFSTSGTLAAGTYRIKSNCEAHISSTGIPQNGSAVLNSVFTLVYD